VRYRLDLEGVQEVRWDKEGTVEAEGCAFKYRRKLKSIRDIIFCISQKSISC
jgi:hypothetical protein